MLGEKSYFIQRVYVVFYVRSEPEFSRHIVVQVQKESSNTAGAADVGISKMSVEETSQKNLGIDTVDAGSDQLPWSRLSTNIVDISYSVLGRVCLKLNIRDDLQFKDFRMLGEKLGFHPDVIFLLQEQKNPTDTLLKMWGGSERQATVGRLIELLKEKDMERLDVVEILEAWVQSKVN